MNQPLLSEFRSWPMMAGELAASPSYLFWRDRLPSHIIDKHDEGGVVHPISIYEVTGAEYGGLGLLSIQGEAFAPTECFPDYLEPMVRTARSRGDSTWYGALFSSKRSRIKLKQRVLAPFHPNFIYGHFLLEMFGSLLLLDRWDTTGAPVLLSSRSPTWVKAVVETIVPKRPIVWFDSWSQTVLAPAFVICSAMQTPRHHLHSGLKDLIEQFKRRLLDVGGRAGKLVYLSRRRAATSWHSLRNELEVERVFRDFSFEIIHPQELSFVDQVKLFDQCAAIAGEFSSALHNSLFARKSSRVLAINWINWYQSRIGALLEQPVAYVPNADGTFLDFSQQSKGFQHIEVDIKELQNRLDVFMSHSFESQGAAASVPKDRRTDLSETSE